VNNRSVLAILGFVSLSWIVTLTIALLSPQQNAGTIGDTFGSINALFSGLAFAGLIYAILLQRAELELQRNELSATREEIKGQRAANEEQNRFISQQTFENSLFQMLAVLEAVLDAIDRRSNGGGVLSKGRDSIRYFYENFRDEFAGSTNKDPVVAYDAFYQEYGHEVGHYFRVLYNIFKFIDKANHVDKEEYSKIVRAQMSDHEVLFLFYNSLTARGHKFLPYINKYGLLKFTRPELLLQSDHIYLHTRASYGSNAGAILSDM
jgi:hypothetical protein